MRHMYFGPLDGWITWHGHPALVGRSIANPGGWGLDYQGAAFGPPQVTGW